MLTTLLTMIVRFMVISIAVYILLLFGLLAGQSYIYTKLTKEKKQLLKRRKDND